MLAAGLGSLCLQISSLKALGPPCNHSSYNTLQKHIIKPSCLTTHLSPLCPRCLFNHTVCHLSPEFRRSRKVCGWNDPNLHSSSFRDEARRCSRQINLGHTHTQTHKLHLSPASVGEKIHHRKWTERHADATLFGCFMEQV